MSKKTVHEIISAASDDDIRLWWTAMSDDEGWPATMPIPAEAYRAVWMPLQKKFLSLPAKEVKTDVKG